MTTADTLVMEPLSGPFDVTIDDLPGSKSLTNRALLLAALARGDSRLSNVLVSDDAQRMLEGLRALGFDVLDPSGSAHATTVSGQGGQIPHASADLFLGNAGTAVRFLTAACAQGVGPYGIDGVERMRERPIAQLVDLLRELGAEVDFLGVEGCPPLSVRGGTMRGGSIVMRPTLSSQYISALMQIGPCLPDGLQIKFEGPVLSRPYVEMTAGLMRCFGATVNHDAQWSEVSIASGGYQGTDLALEPDASNASYFLAAAAITPGARCVIRKLGRSSLQGDVRFVEILGQMGCAIEFEQDHVAVTGPEQLCGVDVNLNAMPDMAQTLAVVALFAEGPTVIRDVGNLRVKETDRMAALQIELMKLGAKVIVERDDLHIRVKQPGVIEPAEIETYDDHRMAMAFAVAGLRASGVTILDPACVNKTFPTYWEFLRRLRG